MHNKYSIMLLLLLVMNGVAFGQSKLTLDDAIAKGLDANFDIRIQDRTVDINRNNNKWGEAGRYPRIDFQLNQNNTITDNIETATPFQLKDQIMSNSVNPAINLNWVLFDGLRINISKYKLEKLQEESEGNADIVVSNTVQAIILGYYQAVFARERLSEFERQMQLSRDEMEYIRTRKEIGGAVTTDLLLEETNYLTDSTNYINQQLDYRNTLRQLNYLMGENPDMQYDLTDSLQINVGDYDLDDLVNKMETENVDIRKQYLSQAIIEYDLRLAKSEKHPTVNLVSFYNYTKNRLDLSNASFPADGGFVPGPADPLNSATANYAVNFTLSWNLFNGGKINRAIQNARIQEDIGNIQIDKLKTSLRRDLADAYDRYNIRRQIYGVNVRKREVAELNLEISQEKFRNGTINSFNFRTVQNNLLIASIQELQSLYNLIDSNVELMRLTGGIIRVYREEDAD